MKILYLDCFSGINGEMTLAALIDAGANYKNIENQLKKLPIEPFSLQYFQVIKKGITALQVVVLSEHNCIQRSFSEIKLIISDSTLSENVKTNSEKIFTKIAKAKAKIGNTDLHNVHFTDPSTIVSIFGVCLALDELGIEQIYSSPIPLGNGQTIIEQEIYPIPTPVTLEILKGIPVRSANVCGEMTTSTGAGIVTALGSQFIGYPSMVIEEIGYGADTKDFSDRPNVLRAIIGHNEEDYLAKPQFHIHEHLNQQLEDQPQSQRPCK